MNIKDIAALANVGVSTVSRVLNNHPDVNDETRKKVLEVIKENNYVPNNSARILKQSNTRNIGILVKGVFNPFFSEILKLVSVGIQEAGYTMILQHHNNENDIGTLLGFIKEKKLQGIICLGGNFIDLTDDDLEEVAVPIILLSVDSVTRKNLKRCSSVSIHNKQATYMGMEYLIENGHKHIALILGEKADYGVSFERYAGYTKALEDYKIEFKQQYVAYGQYEYEDAYIETQRILKKSPEITAVFAISDIMAVGAAKACFDAGRVVGKDIAVMGFDGMDISKYYEPSITTIKQPKAEMSKLSVEMLLKLLERKMNNEHTFLDVELVKRQSCFKI